MLMCIAVQATRNLIHRLTERSLRSNGFVSVEQLSDILRSVDLHMSTAEVEALAIGFAGDGKGNINAKELIQAIHALMYNTLGRHHVHCDENNKNVSNAAHPTKPEDLVVVPVFRVMFFPKL